MVGVFTLLITGESFLTRYVMAGMSLLLIWVGWTEMSPAKSGINFKWLAGCWLAWIVWLVLSTGFSHLVPLSLDALNLTVFGGLFFWTFLLVNEDFIKSEWISWLLIGCGLGLVALSALFMWQPGWGLLLPGMNVVYALYGHNHLAAYLLLVLPLSWHFAIGKSLKWWAIPLVLSFGLLVSFGRITLAISIIQVLILLIVNWRRLPNKLVKGLVALIVLGMMGVAGIKGAYMVADWRGWELPCPAGFKQKLCKTVRDERRPEYWRQAWEGVKNYPSFGYGPGTFTLVNRKYRLAPSVATAFAHNAYAQAFAETGVIGGGLFTLLVGSMLVLGIKPYAQLWWQRKKWQEVVSLSQSTLILPLILAVGGMYVNVFFDFDWNFTSLWAITLLLLALLLKASSSLITPIKGATFTRTEFKINRLVLLGLASWILLVGGVLVLVETVMIVKSKSAAAVLFPYFSFHRTLLLQDVSLTEPAKARLYQVYKNEPDVYHIFLSWERSAERRFELKQHVAELDPWHHLYQRLNEEYFKRGEYERAAEELWLSSSLSEQANQKYLYAINEDERKRLSDGFFEIGNYWFAVGDVPKAVPLLQKSYQLRIETFAEQIIATDSAKINQKTGDDNFMQLINSMPEVVGEHFGKQRDRYSSRYFDTWLAQIKTGEIKAEELPAGLQTLIRIAPWMASPAWSRLSEYYSGVITESLAQNNIALAQQSIDGWWLVWQEVSKTDLSKLDYQHQEALAATLVKVGNQSVGHRQYAVGQDYQRARKLFPWILNNHNQWLSTVEWRTVDPQEVLVFAKSVEGLTGDSIGWRGEDYQRLFQKAALIAIENEDWPQAEYWTNALLAQDPKSVRTQAQLGYFYAYQGDWVKAGQAFQECLRLHPENTECKTGNAGVSTRQSDKSAYLRKALQIMGFSGL